MKELLESGVHFGHQTRRWDPRMSRYIFIARNGIHIIDLQKTMQLLRVAYNAMKEIVEDGGKVLFVGTKKQAKAAVVRHTESCNMFHISERWPGGLLTNYETVKKSVQRLKDLEKMKETDIWDAETKKEILDLTRELAKKNKMLSGIKDMNKLPDALFIIDPKREAIAVREARKLGIPIFAVVDTNCNPDEVTYPIPGNDDAIRAIDLFLRVISSAVIEGQSAGQAVLDEELNKDIDETKTKDNNIEIEKSTIIDEEASAISIENDKAEEEGDKFQTDTDVEKTVIEREPKDLKENEAEEPEEVKAELEKEIPEEEVDIKVDVVNSEDEITTVENSEIQPLNDGPKVEEINDEMDEEQVKSEVEE